MPAAHLPDLGGTGFYGRGGDHHRFPFGCVEFLYRWLTGCVGLEDRDADAASDIGEGELRFFPARSPGPSRGPDRPVEITIVFAGIGRGADGLPQPSTDPVFEPGKTMEERLASLDEHREVLNRGQAEATAAVEQWTSNLPEHGITLMQAWLLKYPLDEPQHWEIRLEFIPEQEDVAKRVAVDLATDLGIAIKECRTLEHDLAWHDVVERTARRWAQPQPEPADGGLPFGRVVECGHRHRRCLR